MARAARASSPTPRSASAARRARSRASSGTSCPTTASTSPACRTTTPSHLGASTWRHVASSSGRCRWRADDAGASRWLMMSDVCKHCAARRLPRELPDRRDHPHRVRHGLRAAGHLQRLRLLRRRLPVRRDRPARGRRPRLEVHALLRPPEGRPGAGCAKACPTDSIQFGELDELRGARRGARGRRCTSAGVDEAYLYGADAASQPGTGGLNAFFLLLDEPEVYNLPPDPVVPAKKRCGAGRRWRWPRWGWRSLALAAVVKQ